MNIFDFILIASERVREINRDRKLTHAQLHLIPGPETDRFFLEQRKIAISAYQAFEEIESGKIDKEYLKKVRRRFTRKN